MKTKLTDKRSKFCKEYLKCGMNITKAAKKSGFSEKTAYSIGSELLKKPEIQAEIQRLRQNTEETLGITREMIIREHLKIAFASMSDLHNTWIDRKDFDQLTDDQKSCIAEISTQIRHMVQDEQVVEIEFVKIKLFDKQKALDSISKIMGYDSPTETNVHLVSEKGDIQALFPFAPPKE